MRLLEFRMQPMGDVIYQTDDLDSPKFMEYQQFRLFLFSLNQAVQDKAGLIHALDSYRYIRYKIKSGKWEVLPDIEPSSNYKALYEYQIKLEEQEMNKGGDLTNRFKSMIQGIGNLVGTQDQKKKKINLRFFQ